MTKLHIVKLTNAEEGILLVEMNERTFEVETSEVGIWITNGLEVTFEEEDEIIEALKCTTIKYITVDTDADGSGSHDVYEHEAIIERGEVKMDIEGKFIKSYKTEKSAVKFANTLAKDVRVS